MTRLTGFQQKGWGHEMIFVSNDNYCGKKLVFRKGGKFSMHFHREKVETWIVLSGKFQLEIINTKNACKKTILLEKDSVWTNEALVPHQLTCIEEGVILEISTPDSVEDNYRVIPGDSQVVGS